MRMQSWYKSCEHPNHNYPAHMVMPEGVFKQKLNILEKYRVK